MKEAVQSGNPAVQEAARAELQFLGITERSIRNIEKTANETEAQRLFSQMPAGNLNQPAEGTQVYF